MKKLISVFLVTALVLTNFQGWDCLKEVELFKNFDLFQGLSESSAETGTLLEGTGIYYTISNNEVTITDADSSISGDLIIPENI